MKSDVDHDSRLATVLCPRPGWQARFGAASGSTIPNLRDAILGLPRDDALRRAYLRGRWSADQGDASGVTAKHLRQVINRGSQ
jgi:hypothetical protein